MPIPDQYGQRRHRGYSGPPQALKGRRIAGAADDVFEQEPLEAGSSPKQAAVTEQVIWASGLMAAENVIQVLRGERPHDRVNPEVLATQEYVRAIREARRLSRRVWGIPAAHSPWLQSQG
jgi:hypothetical protein